MEILGLFLSYYHVNKIIKRVYRGKAKSKQSPKTLHANELASGLCVLDSLTKVEEKEDAKGKRYVTGPSDFGNNEQAFCSFC